MVHLLSVANVVKWQKRRVIAEKRAIKEELDQHSDDNDPGKRLIYATDQIQELEQDDTPGGRLRRFIFIVSALVHHSRFGGLKDRQVRRLANLAYAILQTEGIQPGKSRLAFLYGELHLALSQIYRKTGDHWLAAWEQQTSFHLSGKEPPGGEGFQFLSMGIRSIRLGHCHKAIEYFRLAEEQKLPDRQFMQARLGLIRALRLTGSLGASEKLATDTGEQCQPNAAEKRELEWDAACREVQDKGDMNLMLRMVRKGADHYLPVYLLEAFLWAKCLPERRFEKKLPTIRYLARKKDLKIQNLGILYEAASVMETCYDYDIPISIRLRKLGEILARTSDFVTLDTELLFWAAAGRWLARSHLFSMTSLVLSEYQMLNLRQSLGDNPDVLGLVSDLMAKPWFDSSRYESATYSIHDSFGGKAVS